VPGDDQDEPADSDDGVAGAAATGDPPVPLAEERIGARCADGGFAESSGEVAVASGRGSRNADICGTRKGASSQRSACSAPGSAIAADSSSLTLVHVAESTACQLAPPSHRSMTTPSCTYS